MAKGKTKTHSKREDIIDAQNIPLLNSMQTPLHRSKGLTAMKEKLLVMRAGMKSTWVCFAKIFGLVFTILSEKTEVQTILLFATRP